MTLSGAVPDQLRVDTPSDDTTYDLRQATFTGDGVPHPTTGEPMIYPVLLGKAAPPTGLCVVGGSVPGMLRRTMTWPQLKAEVVQPDGHRRYYDAAAVTIFARGDAPHLVDGLRVDDVADGVAARGTPDLGRTALLDGQGFLVRDAYFTRVRDDCVDVNDLVSGIVADSLLDGCYTGISERPDAGSPRRGRKAPAGSRLVVDHVLVHMTAFPGPHPIGRCHGDTPGYNEIFKWSPGANRPFVRHSIFLLDAAPCSDRYFPFPADAQLDHVVVVWAGPGRWRWPLPHGAVVTADHTVWDQARATWLARHGCPVTNAGVAATANACTRLSAPA